MSQSRRAVHFFFNKSVTFLIQIEREVILTLVSGLKAALTFSKLVASTKLAVIPKRDATCLK